MVVLMGRNSVVLDSCMSVIGRYKMGEMSTDVYYGATMNLFVFPVTVGV